MHLLLSNDDIKCIAHWCTAVIGPATNFTDPRLPLRYVYNVIVASSAFYSY